MIVVDKHVFERNRSGSVSAGIWLALSSGDFPATGWDDFAVAVLSALTTAVLRLLSGAGSSETVHFIEGPFTLQLEMTSAAELRIVAFERRRVVGAVKHDQLIDALLFCQELRDSSRRVVEWCDECGWMSHETRGLSELTAELSRQIRAKLQQRGAGPSSLM